MIKPIRNQVLVKAMKEEEVSSGGIIVPEYLRKDGAKVEIVAVGEGTPQKPMSLKPGMIGFRVDDWGIPVEDDGNLYYLMHQDAILATT
jgi:co-chaperonin GroES (HSP10)